MFLLLSSLRHQPTLPPTNPHNPRGTSSTQLLVRIASYLYTVFSLSPPFTASCSPECCYCCDAVSAPLESRHCEVVAFVRPAGIDTGSTCVGSHVTQGTAISLASLNTLLVVPPIVLYMHRFSLILVILKQKGQVGATGVLEF